jgi:hypothetical protein
MLLELNSLILMLVNEIDNLDTYKPVDTAINSNKSFDQRVACHIALLIICIFAYASNSLADTGKTNSSSTNSTNNEVSHKCVNELSNDHIFNNDIVIGSRDAQVIVVEYFAPTCTHCLEYHLKVFPELKRKYIDTGKIAYVMRECVGNKQDFDASILSRCQDNTASYLELMHHILTTQDSWAHARDYRQKLTDIANQYGILPKQYDLCLNDSIKSKILFDHVKLLASDTDFIGTPSFYINGKLFKAEYSTNGLFEAIESELTAD